ncbi:ribosomal protein L17 [Saitoella complicata NRRL Y-17804]|uniref:ribosomal protein L17 n=1 Tax=Saitoella complicata (strain BCRC 22490 / CBS 7301 / JCM 7358 / NBRC 10748 / NRRL Y-17804) TaxID=698492 RepID=UPI00086754A6|nr:ribosomal protein L17 [Saitoella complicata NRRL Y-17804]ODQ53011.1 ribosomal protein L17 [Saitoella complicata NRRL Y-17804]
MPIKRNMRGLHRTSSHRNALLRNMVVSLVMHESILTTWHKAKEAQSVADKIITMGKQYLGGDRNALIKARGYFYNQKEPTNKLSTILAQRYKERPGGYTRVLRADPRVGDKAQMAVLEFVDGARDTRFAMTARTLAHDEMYDKPQTPITLRNIVKVTRYRGETGTAELKDFAQKFKAAFQRRGFHAPEQAPKEMEKHMKINDEKMKKMDKEKKIRETWVAEKEALKLLKEDKKREELQRRQVLKAQAIENRRKKAKQVEA